MKVCSTLQEFNTTLSNYKVSDAPIHIKESAITKLFELNKDLLNNKNIPIEYSIEVGDLEDT